MNKWQNLGNLYVTQKLTAEFAKRELIRNHSAKIEQNTART